MLSSFLLLDLNDDSDDAMDMLLVVVLVLVVNDTDLNRLRLAKTTMRTNNISRIRFDDRNFEDIV